MAKQDENKKGRAGNCKIGSLGESLTLFRDYTEESLCISFPGLVSTSSSFYAVMDFSRISYYLC